MSNLTELLINVMEIYPEEFEKNRAAKKQAKKQVYFGRTQIYTDLDKELKSIVKGENYRDPELSPGMGNNWPPQIYINYFNSEIHTSETNLNRCKYTGIYICLIIPHDCDRLIIGIKIGVRENPPTNAILEETKKRKSKINEFLKKKKIDLPKKFLDTIHEDLLVDNNIPEIQADIRQNSFLFYQEYSKEKLAKSVKDKQDLIKNDFELLQKYLTKLSPGTKEYIRGLNQENPTPHDKLKQQHTTSPNTHNLSTILFGPPGTGKTYHTAQKALEILNSEKEISQEEAWSFFKDEQGEGTIEFVTFHQSYSYEEFVEGLRPVLGDDEKNGSAVKYEIIPGIFRRMVEKALESWEKNNENPQKYVLIIDEINRGNISSIFGELITLLEEDKRCGAAHEIELKLPYSKEPFKVPPNLYIIGTMNTADRSIALIDIALRRRFRFEEMMPDYKVLSEHLNDEKYTDGKISETINLVEMLKTMNKRIEVLLDRDHMIGHAYFLKIKNIVDESVTEKNGIQQLAEIFSLEIIPLLQEYFFDDFSKIDMILGGQTKLEKGFLESEQVTVSKLFPNTKDKGNAVIFDTQEIISITSLKNVDLENAFKRIYTANKEKNVSTKQ